MDVIEDKLRKLENRSLRVNAEKGEVDRNIGELKSIKSIVRGLENTERRTKEGDERYKEYREGKLSYNDCFASYYDPGKYDTAYYFVSRISGEDIIANKEFEPKLYSSCPKCKKESPVIMSYEQTEDSPEGDTWEIEAFIICCEKIHKIKHSASSSRFLTIE